MIPFLLSRLKQMNRSIAVVPEEKVNPNGGYPIMTSRKAILIMDGNNIVWRASFNAKQVITDEGGEAVSTTILDSMLGKRIRGMKTYDDYDDVIVLATFDAGGKIRHNDARIDRWSYFTDYKANRADDHTDESETKFRHERSVWKNKWKDSLEEQGIIVCEHPSVEADDIIAYTSGKLAATTDGDIDVAIWTADKDLMQCINDDASNRILMYRKRGDSERLVDEKEALAERGVPVSKIRAQLALQGDSSDDYKGLNMYGGKRGLKVVNESDGSYGSLETLLMEDEKQRLSKKIKSGDVNWDEFEQEAKDKLRRNWDLAGCGQDYMPSSAIIGADMAMDSILDSI